MTTRDELMVWLVDVAVRHCPHHRLTRRSGALCCVECAADLVARVRNEALTDAERQALLGQTLVRELPGGATRIVPVREVIAEAIRNMRWNWGKK